MKSSSSCARLNWVDAWTIPVSSSILALAATATRSTSSSSESECRLPSRIAALLTTCRYAENGSLLQTTKAFGKLNERLVANYVVKILEGLHYLHQCDVVHCDLKAANILTTKTGNVKLSDFGVSLNMRAVKHEYRKDVQGTPNWIAPEVIELKGASSASDIWSLGCTVVELFTGKPPYAEVNNSMSGKPRLSLNQLWH
jgi:serine/threonine protein kinase